MPSPRLLLWKALHHLTSAGASAYQYFDAFTSELMVAAVPPEYWHELTVSLYSENRLLYSVHHQQRLFQWETEVIDRHFSKPPGKILVGACGNGREMIQLARRGYDVAGFDPSTAALERARPLVPAERLLALECGTYEDLAESRLREIAGSAPYDAVLLGWGSLAHVHDAPSREALFRTVHRLCPSGPVLFSWIRKPPEGPHRPKLRAVLRKAGFERKSEAHVFRSLVGFYTALSDDDVDVLARATGYRVIERGDQGPYALFGPA